MKLKIAGHPTGNDRTFAMMEIVLATKNRDKIREIKSIMKGVKFLFPKNLPEVKEDGKTLRENAIHKAEMIANYTGKMALADDSGLEVEALGGMPGVKSARFAGEKVSYTDNNRKLLELMCGISKREAKFRCVIALASPGTKTMLREGICRGRIAEKPSGKYGFGYDPLFIPLLSNTMKKRAGFTTARDNKTFAELAPSVKNSISHRAKALKKVYNVLKTLASSK